MVFDVTTDPTRIAAVLGRAVREDPVHATVLGTIALGSTDTAWAAWDGRSVAARAADGQPVALTGPWPDVIGLAGALHGLTGVRRVSGPAEPVERLMAALDRPIELRRPERLYRCDTLRTPHVPGGAIVAGGQHRTLVREWFVAFAAHTLADGVDRAAAADRALDEGGVWLWLDAAGAPASFAARRPAVAGSARIGPVYTPPEERGHGYGSAVTAAATASVLADDAVPVLFTDLANPTSNAIYAALGYRPVEDRLSVLLADRPR